MKTYKIISILALALTLTLFSCDETEEDTAGPEITIHSPQSTDSYMSGDTAHIHIEVVDNDMIHEIAASLNRTHMGTTDEVWHVHAHPDATAHSMHDNYIIAVPGMHNDFELTVVATDHNGNETTKVTAFHVHM